MSIALSGTFSRKMLVLKGAFSNNYKSNRESISHSIIVSNSYSFKDFEVLEKICIGSSSSIHQSNKVKAHNYFLMEYNVD